MFYRVFIKYGERWERKDVSERRIKDKLRFWVVDKGGVVNRSVLSFIDYRIVKC